MPPHSHPPTVSAIIIAHNGAPFVGAAIESVLAQTRPVDEVVVVDDGSTDETPAVVARHAAAGVRYIRQENRGPSAARNRGLAETSGELVAFLDCDDLWLPEKTARQVARLAARPETALVSAYLWWWETAEDRRWVEPIGAGGAARLRRALAIRNVLGPPSAVMLRRAILAESGAFDPARRWGEDWDLWRRVVARAGAEVVPAPLVVYRSHPDNTSARKGWRTIDDDLAAARAAIAGFRPAWWRPLLRARARSEAALRRAEFGWRHGFPRHRQLWYAGEALLLAPAEKPGEKARGVARAALGDARYARLKRAAARARAGRTG